MGYMLKVVVFEDRWQKNMVEIIDLCKKTDIKEIFIMEQYHEILLTPYTVDKHRAMADICCKMADEFRREGIVFNVNIGTIVGHVGSEIQENMVLPFQKFVGDNLCETNACYCILDEAWQDYAAEVCSLYAASKPDKIFIDDDFRSLNHTAMFGCFCPIHVAETSKVCGMELTAESLLKHVCGGSGPDIKVKEAWMKVNFEGQLAAARKMRIATEKVNPLTRMGLMNSGENAHSVQGRDMDRLLREFSGDGRKPLSRPAGGGYRDVIHGEMFGLHQTMALSVSVLGKDVQIASEADSWPCSRFFKSMRIIKSQLEIQALAGADDFTININDYLTIPVEQEPDHCNLLISERDRLSLIQEARRGKKAKGFGLPWKKDTAAKMTSRRGNINDILPKRNIDRLIAQFGLPTQFDAGFGNAILGDAVNCYDDNEIRSFLSKGLMIDGQALENLCRRGFGKLVGCCPEGFIRAPSIERLDKNEYSGRFADGLITTNWIGLDTDALYIYKLNPKERARTISTLLDDEMNEIAPAVILYENELGGRVAVFAVPVEDWQWLHMSRAYQVAKIVDWLMYGRLPVRIEGCPNVGPFYYEDESTGEGLLGVVSGNLDAVEMKIHSELEISDFFTGEKDYDLIIEPLSVRFFRTQKKQR